MIPSELAEMSFRSTFRGVDPFLDFWRRPQTSFNMHARTLFSTFVVKFVVGCVLAIRALHIASRRPLKIKVN